jgi:hypothetical protein
MNKHYLRKSRDNTRLVLFVCLLSLTGSQSQARQFRILTPIATPSEQTSNLPKGAIPIERPQPLSRGDIEPLLQQVIEKWNSSEMASTLSDQFYDKSRLLDVMDTGVPREAKLRIQSIQGIQTLQQYLTPDPEGGRGERVSIVSATVRTQLEFNSPMAGLVSLPGTNEFILKITTAAPP